MKIEHSGLEFPTPKPVKALQELAMDGTQEGYEVAGDIEEGTDGESDGPESDEPEDLFTDGGGDEAEG